MQDTVGTPALWIGFAAFIIFMLALDLGVFHRKSRDISTKEAAVWTLVWIALAGVFNAFVFWQWGSERGESFLAGYLIEKALSVDNLFVFYAIFSAFRVETADQHRLLFWGILGAIVLRAAMVWGGAILLGSFHWLVYVFGLVLIYTGVKMLARPKDEPHPEQGKIFRFLKRALRTTEQPQGSRLFVREAGVWRATPFFLVLLVIELSDIIFALDSILAIFAITVDPFIVFTSNIFAVMGMRSLYIVLAKMSRRFVYLQPGLALVMLFVGVKMAVGGWFHIPVVLSLLVVALLLGGSILASILKGDPEARRAVARERNA